VEVLYEYAPGTFVGTVMEITRDDDGNAWCTVSYVLNSRIIIRIEESRITVTIMPYKEITSSTRGRRQQAVNANTDVI
jgi:hypothetical protein